uniref:Uncharacterized protein n=1 Tax=Arundo donax TaxID=35708 RepID=A0A0A9AYZ6_ARUDO
MFPKDEKTRIGANVHGKIALGSYLLPARQIVIDFK